MDSKVEILHQIMKLMDWDRSKATLWYEMPNPFFGGLSPKEMVSLGRAHKVLGLIAQAQEASPPIRD